MGVLGNPAKYSLVTGENEEDSPWEPLHVEHGLKKEDSAISLSFPNSYQQLNSYATDDMGLLKTITSNIMPRVMGSLSIMITPPNARILAGKGWTKDKIKTYIMENTFTDRDHLPRYPGGDDEKKDPREAVPVFRSRPGQPPPIQIFVAGGWGSLTGLLSGQTSIMEKIELPADWDKLVAKYRNVVPTYVRY